MVNFPFIFLAIVQLSPLQAIAVVAISVFAQEGRKLGKKLLADFDILPHPTITPIGTAGEQNDG